MPRSPSHSNKVTSQPRVVPTGDDARSAAKARYFERWGRAIEADGQSAFVAAAKERALVWITDQRARVADELRHRPNTPLSEFDNLDAWATDGLELWFRAAEDRVTLAALVESLKIEKRGRLEWEEYGCLAIDDEWLDAVDFAEIYDSDFGRPFTNPFSITQWRAQPPWQLVRAFVELGRAVHACPDPLDKHLAGLTRDLARYYRSLGEPVDPTHLVGVAMLLRSFWLQPVVRPPNAPTLTEFDAFIEPLQALHGDSLQGADLADIWIFFAPQDETSMKSDGGRDVWRHRLVAYRDRVKAGKNVPSAPQGTQGSPETSTS